MKTQSFKGVLIDKFLDPDNHMVETLKIKTQSQYPIKVTLSLEQSDFYNKIEI